MHPNSRLRNVVAGSLGLALSACGLDGAAAPEAESVGGAEDDELDAADASFLGGKADVGGIVEGSAEACAVLKLSSLATFEELDIDAKLASTAARKIVAYRAGADGLEGTADDAWYGDLRTLDAVKYVGPKAFKLLRAAAAQARWSCGTVDVQLLAFNDFHSNLKPPTGSGGRIQTGPDAAVHRVDAGGVEYLATHLARLRETNPNTVIVSAGDVIGAAPLLSALFHDEPTIESMNLLGLAVASVGNHEFDEGQDELLRMQYGGCHPVDGCQDGDGFDGAAFEYLGANVIDDATEQTLLPAYTIRRFGHASIAFIGLTLEGTALVTTAEGTRGLSFRDEADTVNALVPELQEKGVQTIVVLIHEGGASSGLYNECVGISGPLFEIVSKLDPAVDVVVAGHTNAAHVCDVGGRLVTSAAHAGRLITDIDLTIDERTGEVVTKVGNNVIVTRDVALDADQTALIAKYDRIAAPLANRVVARLTADVTKLQNAAGESTLGQIIADGQLLATTNEGAVAAFMNPGGIRTDLVAAQISGGEQAGELTYAELFAVQPFGNTLMTRSVTGAQLETMLEQQWSLVGVTEKFNGLAVSVGFTYEWSGARPLGDRIDPASIKLDGVRIDAAATYRITVNGFLADGGDGFSVLRQGTDRKAGPLDLEAFEGFVAAHQPLAPGALDRVVKLP